MHLDTLAKAVAFVLMGWVVPAQADEEKIAVEKLPKAVKEAVKEKFPKAEIKGAAKEEEDGKILYEVSLAQKGKKFDLSIEPDGTIAEIEREIEAEDVPKPVLAAFKKKYPKAKIEKVEELTSGGVTSYEMVIVVGKKKPFEVVATLAVKFKKAKPEADEGEDDEKESKAKKVGKKDKDDDDDRKVEVKKGEKQQDNDDMDDDDDDDEDDDDDDDDEDDDEG